MNARRLKLVAILAGIALSALTLLSWTQVWFSVRLETGIYQPEALGLYRSAGYVEREAFGDYVPDPLSVFMEKRL